MKIAIDVREACRSNRAGKGNWVRGCVSALLKHDHQWVLLTDADCPAEWQEIAECIRFPAGWRWHWEVRRSLKKHSFDAYLSPSSYIVPALVGKKVPCFPVVHDLVVYRKEPHDRKATWIERMLLPRVVRAAAQVFCVSETTKRDLLRQFPFLSNEHISVVYAGPLRVSPEPNRGDRPIVLCVGTLSPRKNQLGLIRAYASLPESLRKQYSLVLIGARGWKDDAVVQLAEQTPNVEWRGVVSDQEYEELLTHSTVLAQPSLYEGFGLQVLDGLQRGVPVLTSSRGATAEVAGNAALLVEPNVCCSIAEGLEELLTNEALRQQLHERGPRQAARFSWEATATALLSSLEKKVT